MALWRLTLGASAFALLLASQAVAEERLALPEPPEPAPVVIAAADLAFPEPPEPAPVVIDIAVAGPAGPATEEASPRQERAPALAEAPASPPDDAAATTAALPPARHASPIEERWRRSPSPRPPNPASRASRSPRRPPSPVRSTRCWPRSPCRTQPNSI